MHDGGLYGHAQTVTVTLEQGPVEVCVSRLPLRPGAARERLILLHGNPASMHDFGPLAGMLRADFDVVAVDLPGFGRSGNLEPTSRESILDSYARCVVAAIDRVAPTAHFHVLGHSHGAAVAQTIAALFPERVTALILLGSVGTPAHWGYRQLVMPGVLGALRVIARTLKRLIPRPLRWRIIQAVMTPIFSPYPLETQWIDEQLAVVEARPEILVNMALVAAGDPCAQLARTAAQIRAPSLFIHGDSDRLVPSVYPRAIYAVVSQHVSAEFHELPRIGHMLHISHPEQVHALIVDWLARR
jgi:pimeloyl-ACP methyl ester carboxylesterase